MERIIAFLIVLMGGIFVFAVVMALPVMLLWNYLMPYLFNLKEIDLFRSAGLLLLSGFLFMPRNLYNKKKND